jgi:hypothetical protein
MSEHEFMLVENELRHSLMRGYRQVRAAQTQGVYLRGAECALELLGDPHLLLLTYPSLGLRLRIPVVFIADWELGRADDAGMEMTAAFNDPERVLTGYRRRLAANEKEVGIHAGLVHRLQELVRSFPDRRVLLDWMWAPRPHEDNHDEIRSENWFAYHQAQDSPNSVFTSVGNDVPSQIRSVDGLVRLSFPLCAPRVVPDATPAEMVTIVLGLEFERIKDFPHQTTPDLTSRIANAVRGIAGVLMREIPHLYSVTNERKQHTPTLARVPDWAFPRERDALHSAVDDLHRKIIALATRVGLEGWERPENGFKFVLALRELDDTDNYQAKLRYQLSVYNLRALGAGYEDPQPWKEACELALNSCTPALTDVFERDSRRRKEAPRMRAAEYLERCHEEIESLFARDRDVNDVRQRLAQDIEGERYNMRLTPGYWVMDLCHPEVIREWLRDPRAMRFDRYPAKLLVWEASALPKEIYYSPIVDGAVPIGVCGVSNDLIEKSACPAYELQELIDESAPRFRRILTSNELDALGHEVRTTRGLLGDADDGSKLWMFILRRFRRLAYYYLPAPTDYHTKLVRNDSLAALFADRRWERFGGRWWQLSGLSSEEVETLANVPQVVPQGAALTTDYVKMYLQEHFWSNPLNEFLAMPGGYLHRVSVADAPELSLLVLVPHARHNDLAHELINRFSATCELALREHREQEAARGPGAPREKGDRVNGPFDVFLSYSRADKEVVGRIAEELYQRGVIPWHDATALRPGDEWPARISRQIETIPCGIIVIGPDGLGKWQETEMWNLLIFLKRQNRRIIPVLIGKATAEQIPPLFSHYNAVHYTGDDDPVGKLVEVILSEREQIILR